MLSMLRRECRGVSPETCIDEAALRMVVMAGQRGRCCLPAVNELPVGWARVTSIYGKAPP
jgi:hypothetical protein